MKNYRLYNATILKGHHSAGRFQVGNFTFRHFPGRTRGHERAPGIKKILKQRWGQDASGFAELIRNITTHNVQVITAEKEKKLVQEIEDWTPQNTD